MPINFDQLTSFTYLTSRFVPPISKPFFIVWLAVSIGLIVLPSIVRIGLRYKQGIPPAWIKWIKQVGTSFVTMGFISLVLLFFRYQRSPLLSMRILMLVWAIAFIIWLGILVYFAFRRVPKKVIEWQEQQRLAKYLPKSK